MNIRWWRKRNEGFEWRDYVRTTILVRREQRRQRLKDVQAAAAAQVKDAGKRGLEAGVAGVQNASTASWHHAKAAAVVLVAWTVRAAEVLGSGLVSAASSVGAAAAALGRHVGKPLAPALGQVVEFARQPKVDLALKIVAGAAGIGAAYRTWTFGFDGDALVATVVATIAAALLLLAWLSQLDRAQSPGARENLLNRLRLHEFELPGERHTSPRTVGLAVLGLIAVAAIGTLAARFGAPGIVASLTSSSQPATTGTASKSDPSKLEGRAIAITGDRLRIAGTVILLDGIEAPEPSQSCERKTGTWRCGAAAKDALAGLIRGRRVSCEIVDEDESGKRGRCETRGADIAEALARNGNVFSNGGFLSRYADAESEAQSEKIGLWAGTPERPQDYRDKRWEEAKRTAPEGCPIKGRIRSGSRTYVLPWAASYDSVQLRTSRGERWFCSESEAQAAGWTLGSQS
jgi:endonuclease YncB( thermonuclease family)